jgi:hypothetical protein
MLGVPIDAAAHPPDQQHKFNPTTKRCVRCNMQEFRLPAMPFCCVVPDTHEETMRRVEEDGFIIVGPES